MDNLPTHDQIKWSTKDGTVHYGRVRDPMWNRSAIIALRKENLLVDDAIFPLLHTLPVASKYTQIPWQGPEYDTRTGAWKGGDEYFQWCQKHLREAVGHAGKTMGVEPQALLRVESATGLAFYVVNELHKTRARIEWRGFSGTQDRDFKFGDGGLFRVAELERYLVKTLAEAMLAR